MHWIDELRMETPEQIDVDLELVGVGSRFFAKVIDLIFKSIATGFLFFIVLIGVGESKLLDKPSTFLIAILIAGTYLLWLGYGVFFESRWNGQTPGKWLVGIRVIQQGGAPIDFRAAGIRNLLCLADILPMFYILGAVLVLLTSRSQRLGDMAAGTIVIRERKVELGTEVEDALYDYSSDEYSFTTLQLAKLKPSDRSVLREFLRRSDDMDGAERWRLARRLADNFLDKTGYHMDENFPSGSSARRFLASLLRDFEQFLKHN
jgi:uncharacterized RDD family membrane protein YckC